MNDKQSIDIISELKKLGYVGLEEYENNLKIHNRDIKDWIEWNDLDKVNNLKQSKKRLIEKIKKYVNRSDKDKSISWEKYGEIHNKYKVSQHEKLSRISGTQYEKLALDEINNGEIFEDIVDKYYKQIQLDKGINIDKMMDEETDKYLIDRKLSAEKLFKQLEI